MKNYENTIICDVDSVVANLQHSWLGRYNADYQDSLTPEQLTGWGMHAFVKPACGQKIFDYLSDQTGAIQIVAILPSLRVPDLVYYWPRLRGDPFKAARRAGSATI